MKLDLGYRKYLILFYSNLLETCKQLGIIILDARWAKFKTILAAKCDKYSRDLVVIDRWEATSQKCSCCGASGGKKELKVREWSCLCCNTFHDRDIKCDSFPRQS
ncbi:MAG: zinc ribbon domain-containing protein [Prochloraceae cyanobacterium]